MGTGSDVVLVNSNSYSFQSAMPLGLMTVATILRQQHNLDVAIVDLPMENGTDTSIEKVICSVPDTARWVGFTTMCNTLPRTLSICLALRERRPGLPIILGGPQATSAAQALLETYSFIDGIVLGESESVLCDLVDMLDTNCRRNVPGILWQANLHEIAGRSLRDRRLSHALAPLRNLDEIPPIDYKTYDIAPMHLGVMMDVGRGCPYGCTFCSTNDFFRRKFRMKSTTRIVDDMRAVVTEVNPKRVDFVHDMFTTNRKLVTQICHAIIEAKIKVPWSCSARTDSLDPDLIRLMRTAGCDDIFFGIETGSPQLQKVIRKNLNIGEAVDTLLAAHKTGMRVTASLILGFPHETPESLCETVDLFFSLRSVRPQIGSVQLHLLSPLAGTPLTDERFNELGYDGYISDITSVSHLTPWEAEQIKSHREIFSSFYHFRNPLIERSTYRFLYWLLFYSNRFDEFVRIARGIRGEDLAHDFLQYSSAADPSFFEKFDYKNASKSLPLVAEHLEKIALSIGGSESRRLCESVHFGLWKYRDLFIDESLHFSSAFDFIELANDLQGGDFFIYAFDRSSSKIKGLPCSRELA